MRVEGVYCGICVFSDTGGKRYRLSATNAWHGGLPVIKCK